MACFWYLSKAVNKVLRRKRKAEQTRGLARIFFWRSRAVGTEEVRALRSLAMDWGLPRTEGAQVKVGLLFGR